MYVDGDRPWYQFWPEGVPRHVDYPEIPLFELLRDAATKYPQKIAFSCDQSHLTYEEADKLTDKMAAGLRRLGVRKGDRIVLCLPNSLDFVIGYYGILKAGGSVSPANPLNRAAELNHQINDCQASLMITDQDIYPRIREIRDKTPLRTIILTKSDGMEVSLPQILAESPARPPETRLNPHQDIAAVEYTGGTTGLPKGAMLTHYNLVANAIQNATWLGWSHQDVIIGVLPFYHSWGACTCINSPIYSGARVIIIPRFDVAGMLSLIEREKVTVLYGAASMFITLTSSPLIEKYDISSLKYVKAGAMPIPFEIKEKWERNTGVKMILGYGLSEASPETHDSPPQRTKPGTVGIPVTDTDARIVDEETGEVELPPGQIGELVIRGPQVMKGYLNRPEDNREALRGDWLYTGDLAVMDDEGYFRIVDRKKEIIIYKGYNIAPAEVESVIYEHPSVKECAVVGRPDPRVGEVPKAYVVLKDGCRPCADEIIAFCAQKVAPYKKVREVEFIDQLPKTPVGKVLRRLLRDRNRQP